MLQELRFVLNHIMRGIYKIIFYLCQYKEGTLNPYLNKIWKIDALLHGMFHFSEIGWMSTDK